MRIAPFAIEQFYERWEFRAETMLSSSDCEALRVSELLALEPDAERRLHDLHLGYTEVPGSPELLTAVASLYDRAGEGDVLTLAAAEEGIFLANHALLGPGDHAIVEFPSYGSFAALARSSGAQVSVWSRRYEHGWAHDLEQLENLVRDDTRMLYINSPHNPTGRQMPRDVFTRVVEIARERELLLFSDEVYRGLEHDAGDRLPAACEVYERGISLGAVSKAYGLPGLRIGWIVCRDAQILAQMRALKLYTTICSSAPSELLLALALRHADQLIARCRERMLRNLPLLTDFIDRHATMFEWVPPNAAPIGFPRLRINGDVEMWCEQLAERSGVLLLPGTVYEHPEHVRFGFGREDLPEALGKLEADLADPVSG